MGQNKKSVPVQTPGKETLNSQRILVKEEQSWSHHTPRLQGLIKIVQY